MQAAGEDEMSETAIGISIGLICTTADTPQLPDAKRGDFSPTNVRETTEQLHDYLIWSQCTFCGGFVLIHSQPDLKSRYREKCQCGAKRVFRWGRMTVEERRSGFSERPPQDGWGKNGEEWLIC